MTQNAECCLCEKSVSADEIAMTRRLVRKTADEFFCMGCLSERLGISVPDLEKKMAYFKAIGCTLFINSENARRIAV